MGLTLSHASALYVIRKMRADGVNLHDVEPVSLTCPSPWTGKRWTSRLFNSTEWPWPAPTSTDHLHVLVPERRGFIHTANVVSHTIWRKLPANSVLFVDKHTSVVCPELLYLQLADTLTLPQLVLFGRERRKPQFVS